MIATIVSRLLLLPVVALATPREPVRTEHRFLWDEANAHMASAQTQPEFLAAAQTYRKLTAGGVRNGPVFYNLGLALMQAQQYDEALEAFYRAERYAGSNADLAHNILICLAEGHKDQSLALPWYRFLLFWHFRLPATARATVAAGAFLLCWVALLLRLARAPQAAAHVFAAALVVLILFGSSALTSLLQEYQAETGAQAAMQAVTHEEGRVEP